MKVEIIVVAFVGHLRRSSFGFRLRKMLVTRLIEGTPSSAKNCTASRPNRRRRSQFARSLTVALLRRLENAQRQAVGGEKRGDLDESRFLNSAIIRASSIQPAGQPTAHVRRVALKRASLNFRRRRPAAAARLEAENRVGRRGAKRALIGFGHKDESFVAVAMRLVIRSSAVETCESARAVCEQRADSRLLTLLFSRPENGANCSAASARLCARASPLRPTASAENGRRRPRAAAAPSSPAKPPPCRRHHRGRLALQRIGCGLSI